MLLIIGSGLLANSFVRSEFGKPGLLLASGVSDSRETRLSEFDREKVIVSDAIAQNPDRHVIYFSSCSLYQTARTPYIIHKIAMEKLVASTSQSYTIFRLPQAVGVVRNNTVISYVVKQIISGNEIMIQKNAKRNLIGIEDVARISAKLVNSGRVGNSTVNIASKGSVPMIDIVNAISRILRKEAKYCFVEGGESYDIPIDYLYDNLSQDDPVLGAGYWLETLERYVPLVAELYYGIKK